MPRKRSTAVSSLRCRRRASDCTPEECRKACSSSSADWGALADLGVSAAADAVGEVRRARRPRRAARGGAGGAKTGAAVSATVTAIHAANRKVQEETRREKRTCGREYFNGNPRQRQRQNGADGLAGQIGGRGLDCLPGRGGFGLELGLGLAHFLAGRLAGGVEGGVALGAPLLDALLAELVDVGAGLAQALGIFGGLGLSLRRRPCARLPWRLRSGRGAWQGRPSAGPAPETDRRKPAR